MEQLKKNIGIIGIGNLILSDEGFGIHTLSYLEEHYTFPENVVLKDAGTAAIYMAPFLEECDPVFVIDVVDLQAEPGSYHFFTMDDIEARTFQTKMSPHQLGLLEMVEICRLRDMAPEHIEFHCVVPQSLETGMDLSPALAARVEEVAQKIVTRLRNLGVEVTARQSTASEDGAKPYA